MYEALFGWGGRKSRVRDLANNPIVYHLSIEEIYDVFSSSIQIFDWEKHRFLKISNITVFDFACKIFCVGVYTFKATVTKVSYHCNIIWVV